jgi:hypothetical protein
MILRISIITFSCLDYTRSRSFNAPGALARFPFDYRNAFEPALTAPDGHRSVRAMAIIILNVEITL